MKGEGFSMVIEMFNFWYFFWMIVQVGALTGLYFAFRRARPFVQNTVLFSLLALGLLLHFLKMYIPPYGELVNGELAVTDRGWRDSWFVNICGANIALFPIFFLTKNKYLKDYMFYVGVISGLIVLFYPQEPIAKGDAAAQMAEFWDIVRFYYHHWMIMAVPLLMVLWKRHTLSYKRVWVAPVGILLLMLFIILNQIFQSELGFIPLRDAGSAVPNYKNTSYIWGPLNGDGSMDPIGAVFDIFCPSWFKKLPVSCEGYGMAVGEVKYWPWFWMIFPAFILVTPLAFGLCMIFDAKRFKKDVVWLAGHIKAGGLKADFKRLGNRIHKAVIEENPDRIAAK
ncbi:MAG: hypothetical protein E7453_08585 [Ruminococcaceae bacterium]|nr:hypothetical protein [Oscillospiraceae bacterium]